MVCGPAEGRYRIDTCGRPGVMSREPLTSSRLRLYKFQSQIVSYADTHLERLYTFGRFLYKELPKGSEQPSVEFDDELALQYHRLEKSEGGDIKLDKTDGEVQGPTETGTGRGSKEDEVELSTIVEKINEKLGTDFTEADQLFLGQRRRTRLKMITYEGLRR